MITQKFSLKNKLSFKTFLSGLILGWVLIALPLCIFVYSNVSQSLREDLAERRNTQEEILLDIFQQAARFGDLVNARTNIEALGKTFGLRQIYLCRDGIDIIGGMVPLNCPEHPSGRTLEIAGANLSIHFVWQPEVMDTFNPLIRRAIFATCALSFIIVLLIGLAVYRLLIRKISHLATGISKATDAKIEKIEVDLTELEPIAEEIYKLRHRLAENMARVAELQTAEALGQMSRQVAHDIRSPLSALSIFVSKGRIADEASASLISAAVKRIEGIANDLLRGKHVSSGHSSISEVDFENFVRAKQTEHGELIKLRSEFNLAGRIQIPLEWSRLERILSNLVNNSVEARLPNRPCEVLIVVRGKAERLEIEVSDNGRGISESDLKVLNSAPKSLNKNATDSGFGLGLSSAKAVLESVGGQVLISAGNGAGATVVLDLPYEFANGI